MDHETLASRASMSRYNSFLMRCWDKILSVSLHSLAQPGQRGGKDVRRHVVLDPMHRGTECLREQR